KVPGAPPLAGLLGQLVHVPLIPAGLLAAKRFVVPLPQGFQDLALLGGPKKLLPPLFHLPPALRKPLLGGEALFPEPCQILRSQKEPPRVDGPFQGVARLSLPLQKAAFHVFQRCLSRFGLSQRSGQLPLALLLPRLLQPEQASEAECEARHGPTLPAYAAPTSSKSPESVSSNENTSSTSWRRKALIAGSFSRAVSTNGLFPLT